MDDDRRSTIVLGLASLGLLISFPSFPQQKQRVYRIGILRTRGTDQRDRNVEAFIEALRQLGYVEGKNLVIERRNAKEFGGLRTFAAELVRLKVDVMFTANTMATQAAKEVSGTTPLVFSTVSDPVAMGFASSLAKPGGFITGTTHIGPDLNAKRLQLLKEISPKIARVAILAADEPQTPFQVEDIERAAKLLRIATLPIELRGSKSIEQAFGQLRKWHADSVIGVDSAMFFNDPKPIIDAVTDLPSMWGASGPVRAGGLISYGAKFRDLYRRAAFYVDRILRGAKPGELPIEQPMTFELVVNLKTARTLNLSIPPEIRIRATQLIE